MLSFQSSSRAGDVSYDPSMRENVVEEDTNITLLAPRDNDEESTSVESTEEHETSNTKSLPSEKPSEENSYNPLQSFFGFISSKSLFYHLFQILQNLWLTNISHISCFFLFFVF